MKQLRALICTSFGAYSFAALDGLCLDEWVELAGAALWLRDQEAQAQGAKGRKGRR